MSDLLDKLRKNAKPFDPNRSTPIMYGMHLPGIIVCYGIAYNDTSVAAPCYRLADDPRVGYQTAKWVEKEEATNA